MSRIIVKGDLNSLAQKITAGEKNEHAFVSDEPLSLGGQNLGPNPYELLLSALGACTSMTLILYCRMKKLPLTSIEVVVSDGRVHVKDCIDCESTDGYIHEIHRVISLEGSFNDEQRAKLLQIAVRCPIHKTLTNEIKIRDNLVGQETEYAENSTSLEQQIKKDDPAERARTTE